MAVYTKRYFLPLAFVLLNIFCKTLYLSSQAICIDEPFTIYHAQFDIGNLIHYLKDYNNPPLYELILHFWIKCFGIGAESVRTLPMLFSSFTVFFIYKTGLTFFDKRVAFISSALFTLSTMNIWFAHDCRVYSLFVFLTVISFYLFFKLLKEKETFTWPYVLLFSFINLLLVYAHYFGFLVWVSEFLILCFFFLRSKELLKKSAVAFVLAFIGYLPQVVVLLIRARSSVAGGSWIIPINGIESIYNMLWSFCNEPVPTLFCCALFLSALIIYFVKRSNYLLNPYTKYILVWFIFPFFFLFFVSYKIPLFIDRYLLFISPAFYMLLAVSLSFVFKKVVFYRLAVFGLLALFILSVEAEPRKKRDVINMVEWVKTKKDKKTILFACSPDFILNFAYYYNISYFKLKDQQFEYAALDTALERENIYFIHRLNDVHKSKIKNFERVIYLDAAAEFSSPGNKIKQNLYESCAFIERVYFYNQFYLYNFKVNKN